MGAGDSNEDTSCWHPRKSGIIRRWTKGGRGERGNMATMKMAAKGTTITTTGGSAMRLCGIVLPPSKKSRESYTMLFSLLTPISHARLNDQLSLLLKYE